MSTGMVECMMSEGITNLHSAIIRQLRKLPHFDFRRVEPTPVIKILNIPSAVWLLFMHYENAVCGMEVVHVTPLRITLASFL